MASSSKRGQQAAARARQEEVARRASEIRQMRAQQIKWSSRVKTYAWVAITLGFILFAVVEVFMNVPALDRMLRPEAYKGSSAPNVEWNGTLGIADAEAAVIVTALLVLVGTFNVALAATDIGESRTPLDSVRVTSWRGSVFWLSMSGGVIAVTTALTRFAESVGLGLVLFAVAVLTVFAGGTMQDRPDTRTPLLLRRTILLERSAALERSRRRLTSRFFASPRTDFRLKPHAHNQVVLVLWVLSATLLVTVVTLLPAVLHAPRAFTTATGEEWFVALRRTVLPLFTLIGALFTFFGLLTVLDVHVWASGRSRWFAATLALHAVCLAAWLGLCWWAALKGDDPGSWLEGLPFALAPPLVPIVLLGIAARWRRGPGLRLPAWSYSAVAANRRNLCAELSDIRAKLAIQDPA